MPSARYARRIFHAPDDLLALVENVEAYPEFVNLISALRITRREDISPMHTHFEAEALVAYKMINERFASTVDVLRDQHRIEVRKSERGGALKHLENIWTFHPLPDGSTLVQFDIDVRLKAFFLDSLLAQKFDSAAQAVIKAFEARAAQLAQPAGERDYDAGADIARLGLQDALYEG